MSSSDHHVAMNEFADPSQQPPDNRWRRVTIPEPAAPASQAEPDDRRRRTTIPEPAAPASQAEPGRFPADTPVPVRIIWDVGIPPPVDGALGQAEREVFRSLAGPDPGACEVQGVQYRDFTLSDEGGLVLESPVLSVIAVGKFAGVINVLLGPRRDSPRPWDPPRPYGPMGPFDRGPGSP